MWYSYSSFSFSYQPTASVSFPWLITRVIASCVQLAQSLSRFFYFNPIVSVVLEGVPVADRMLLYHNEIPTTTRQAESLSCRSAGASWHYPNGSTVAQFDSNSRNSYIIQRTLIMDSRLIRNVEAEIPTEANLSGLWTCRLDSEAIPLGIYRNG